MRFSGVLSKQTRIQFLEGNPPVLLPLCIVYIVPQHSTLHASEVGFSYISPAAAEVRVKAGASNEM